MYPTRVRRRRRAAARCGTAGCRDSARAGRRRSAASMSRHDGAHDYPGRLDRLTAGDDEHANGVAILAGMLAMVLAIGPGRAVRADEPPDPGFEQTPPRLSLTTGRSRSGGPGAQDWTRRRSTRRSPPATCSPRARREPSRSRSARAPSSARGRTRSSASPAHEPDFLQLTLAAGSAVVRPSRPGAGRHGRDRHAQRRLHDPAGGYYRVDVTGERSSFMTPRRRARHGHAGRRPGGRGHAERGARDRRDARARSSQRTPRPPLDDWDRWNYARTDGSSTR